MNLSNKSENIVAVQLYCLVSDFRLESCREV